MCDEYAPSCTHVLGQVRRTQEHTSTRAVMTSGGLQGEHVGKDTCRPHLKYTCSYVQRRSNRTCGGSWVSGHASTHTGTQADCHEAQRTLCVYQGQRTDTRSHVRDALPCPSTRACTPSQDSREFPETDSSDHRVWGRQLGLQLPGTRTWGPEAVLVCPEQLKKASDRSRVFKMLRIRWRHL